MPRNKLFNNVARFFTRCIVFQNRSTTTMTFKCTICALQRKVNVFLLILTDEKTLVIERCENCSILFLFEIANFENTFQQRKKINL